MAICVLLHQILFCCDGDKTMCTGPLRLAFEKNNESVLHRMCKGIWWAVKAFGVVAAQWLTNVLKQQPRATVWQRRPLRDCGRTLLDLWAAYARTWSKRTNPRIRLATQSHICFLCFFNSTLFFSPPLTPGLDQHKRGSENLGGEIENYYCKRCKRD